eukprot:PhM_4_TR18731/c0_g1_i1/m.65800
MGNAGMRGQGFIKQRPVSGYVRGTFEIERLDDAQPNAGGRRQLVVAPVAQSLKPRPSSASASASGGYQLTGHGSRGQGSGPPKVMISNVVASESGGGGAPQVGTSNRNQML